MSSYGPPVARVGDQVEGFCNGAGHQLMLPFIGQWVHGSPTVFADNIPVVRLGDTGITNCGHSFRAVTASSRCFANDTPIHRVGDQVLTEGDGPGHSTTGSPNVTSL